MQILLAPKLQLSEFALTDELRRVVEEEKVGHALKVVQPQAHRRVYRAVDEVSFLIGNTL